MRRRTGMSVPFLRVFLLILVAGCIAAPMFASTGSRALAVTFGQTADLAISAVDNPDPVVPDGLVTYNVTVTNKGPSDTEASMNAYFYIPCTLCKTKGNPTLNATFPVVESVSSSPEWTCGTTGGNSISCTSGSGSFLPNGSSTNIVIGVRAPSQETTITGSFYVDPNIPPFFTTDPDTTNNGAYPTTTVAFPCPPVFTSTSPVNGSPNEPTSGTLTWASSKADSYNVYFGVSGSGCSTLVGTTTSPQFNYSGLTPGTTYEYRIEAQSTSCAKVGTTSCITFTTAGFCPPVFSSTSPTNGSTGDPTSGVLTFSSTPADLYTVYLGPAGSGCSTFYGTTTSPQFNYVGLRPATQYEYRVDAQSNSCSKVGSTGCTRFTTGGNACGSTSPALLTPASGTTVSSPVTFSWSPVSLASGYILTIVTDGRNDAIFLSNSVTSTTRTVLPGAHQWFVEATFNDCPTTVSTRGSFIVRDPAAICAAPPQTIASIVGESTSGESYHLFWEGVPALNTYQAQEATLPDFSDARTITTTSLSVEFRHEATTPTPYYYRVRGICGANVAEYTKVVRTVVIPKPDPNASLFELVTENGNNPPIQFTIFIKIPAGTSKTLASTFTVVTSAPWLTVSTGPVSPSGLTLAAAVNPATLPVGTSVATVTVSSSSGAVVANPAVSMTLATPITPAGKGSPPDNALVIPAVANVQGQKSKWQSDIRLTNLSGQKLTYQLTYTPSSIDTTADSKITSFDVKNGQTVALDDIVKHLYGLGSLADGTNGVLEFHPLNFNGKVEPVRFNLGTFASSRTYNLAEDGSIGQFIPAVPYARFIGASAPNSSVAPRLSVQAVAQNDNYRTNLGIVEGSGQPANVTIRVFDDEGGLVKQFGIGLRAGEHQQLNSVLAKQNVRLDDGRIELQVTSSTGRIMAYASVVDSRSNDPQLVPAVDISNIKASRYIMAGVTDFTTQFTRFRSDVRIFNAGATSVDARLTLYPETGASFSKTITIGAGKIARLDNIVSTFFGVTNAGGSLYVETAGDSSLVATARTYDLRENGTVGQFIPAVTVDEAVSKSDRALQILQVEQSARFRTNVGVAEVSGKSVMVEVTAAIPDSLTSPVITLQLQPNQFKQLNSVLKQMGFNDQFNARISVKVVGGDGKVTAYGSVIDNKSEDPTYVPAQ